MILLNTEVCCLALEEKVVFFSMVGKSVKLMSVIY